MKLNVFLSPVIVDELYFTGKTTVVIDVLRATSTIATAINNGAKEVVPVASVEFAVKVSGGMFGGQTLLGGERNTKKIEGFALGNSPFEYAKEVVADLFSFTAHGTAHSNCHELAHKIRIDLKDKPITRLKDVAKGNLGSYDLSYQVMLWFNGKIKLNHLIKKFNGRGEYGVFMS